MLSNQEVPVSKLEVIELSGGGFFVARNDRYAHLSADEALMVVAHFIIKKQDHHFLKSENQRIQEEEIRRKNYTEIRIEKDVRKYPALTANLIPEEIQ